MYYPKTVAEIEHRIKAKFPGILPDVRKNEFSPAHLLGMLEEMKKIKNPEKAARWIGWILCDAVKIYQVINLIEAENLVREDLK